MRGYGSLGGNVTNQGDVWPGGSTGTFTITGNYTQDSNGLLTIEVTPADASGRLQVGGSASLGGTLSVTVDSGSYTVGTSYDILHAASGVSGGFSTVTYSQAFAAYITPVVTYSANDVTLKLTAATSGSSPSSDPAFSSGDLYVAANFLQDRMIAGAIAAPLHTDKGYWIQGLGGAGSANRHDIASGGYVLGRGFAVSPDIILGAAFSNDYADTSSNGSHVNGTIIGGEVYGLYEPGRLQLGLSAGGGYSRLAFSRVLPTLHETGQTTGVGPYETAALQLRYRLGGPLLYFTPYAGTTYLHTVTGSAGETGAGVLTLHFGRMETSLGLLQAGLESGYSIPLSAGRLTLWGALGGQGALGAKRAKVVEGLGSEYAPETALAVPEGAFTPSAGLVLEGRQNWRLTAGWGGQWGGAASVQNVTIEGRYVW